MKMTGLKQPFGLVALLFVVLLPVAAQGATLNVNCNGPAGTLNTITAALAKLNPAGPNTINVAGACHENVVIQSFDRLTLKAAPGASINDASGGTGFVLDIEDSTRIAVQNFTINGGDIGVLCRDYSLCRFSGNTVEGAVNDGTGVHVTRSRATFSGDVLQDNAGRGLNVVNASVVVAENVTVRRNGAAGIFVGFGSSSIAVTTLVQENANGIRAVENSMVRLLDSRIIGNRLNGVRLEQSSTATFQTDSTGNFIAQNGLSGVSLADVSFANFDEGQHVAGNNTSTGSVGTDVTCNPQFSATRGALTNIGGGTTNCVEP